MPSSRATASSKVSQASHHQFSSVLRKQMKATSKCDSWNISKPISRIMEKRSIASLILFLTGFSYIQPLRPPPSYRHYESTDPCFSEPVTQAAVWGAALEALAIVWNSIQLEFKNGQLKTDLDARAAAGDLFQFP
jgi:hypothetical protein